MAKQWEIHQQVKSIEAVLDLHTPRPNVPAAVDHGPYEYLHETDEDGECPVCSTLTTLIAVKQDLLDGVDPKEAWGRLQLGVEEEAVLSATLDHDADLKSKFVEERGIKVLPAQKSAP